MKNLEIERLNKMKCEIQKPSWDGCCDDCKLKPTTCQNPNKIRKDEVCPKCKRLVTTEEIVKPLGCLRCLDDGGTKTD